MTRVRLFCLAAMLVGCSLGLAQDEDKLESGPKAGTFLPASFPCYNVNGPSKRKPHSLTGKFALSPSVLIFAKEPAEEKDAVFNDLLKQLDEAAEEFVDRNFSVGVVFLSADARDSSNNPKVEEAKDLIKEAVDRENLIERLEKRGKDLKHVILACYPPEGPPKYNINPKAENCSGPTYC